MNKRQELKLTFDHNTSWVLVKRIRDLFNSDPVDPMYTKMKNKPPKRKRCY